MSDFLKKPDIKENQPQTTEWVIQSSLESSMEYYQKLEKLLSENNWDNAEVYKITYAFHELLINAIVHGNLGLKKLKGNKEQDFALEVSKAEQLPQNASKTVKVTIHLKPDALIIEIQDMGKDSPEFWNSKIEGIRTGADLSWQSGRGIEIAEKFLDKISFEKNNTGIKVTLTKNKTP